MKLNGYTGNITLREDIIYANGHTEYRILIPEQASEAERSAARELTDIFQIAGVCIETVTDEGLFPDPTQKFIALGNLRLMLPTIWRLWKNTISLWNSVAGREIATAAHYTVPTYTLWRIWLLSGSCLIKRKQQQKPKRFGTAYRI